MEDSERQARFIGGICKNVNNISVEKFAHNKPKRKGKGKQGKFKQDVTVVVLRAIKSNDPNCPEKGRKCQKCDKTGHFEAKCWTKTERKKSDKHLKKVSQTETDDYAFIISRVTSSDKSNWTIDI